MPTPSPTRVFSAIAVVLSGMALAACGGADARKAKHLEKGHAYLEASNYEKARVEFQNALQISPVDPEARFENGVVDEKLAARAKRLNSTRAPSTSIRITWAPASILPGCICLPAHPTKPSS